MPHLPSYLAAFQGCAGFNPFALKLMIDLALDGHAHVGGRGNHCPLDQNQGLHVVAAGGLMVLGRPRVEASWLSGNRLPLIFTIVLELLTFTRVLEDIQGACIH